MMLLESIVCYGTTNKKDSRQFVCYLFYTMQQPFIAADEQSLNIQLFIKGLFIYVSL